MVNPIYLIAIPLFVAFLLALLDKLSRGVSMAVFLLGMISTLALSVSYFWSMVQGATPIQVLTAGFSPPLSINLRIDLWSSFAIMMVQLVALFNAIFMMRRWHEEKVYFMVLYTASLLGITGMIMTRDLFNLFVFMEISSISLYGLLGLRREIPSLSASFKYIIAGGLASTLFLLGVAYIYRVTGSLSFDFLMGEPPIYGTLAGTIALFLAIVGILIELKPFPANGWALDVYESTSPGLAAFISAASATGVLFALYKFIPFMDWRLKSIVLVTGIVTFVLSNLIGIRQSNVKRMLGYSSTAQIGLIAAVLVYANLYRMDSMSTILAVGGLFTGHMIAKAGLFWMSGIVGGERIDQWGILRKVPSLWLPLGVFVVGLTGLPPFPSFFGKWVLLTHMAGNSLWLPLAVILLGSLFEIFYLFRFMGKVAHSPVKEGQKLDWNIAKALPVLVFALLLFTVGITAGSYLGLQNWLLLLPILAAIGMYIIKDLPSPAKALVAIAVLVFQYITIVPMLSGMYSLFALMFLGGGAVLMIATAYRSGEKRRGTFVYLLLMLLSMGNLLIAKSTLEFFLFWELMTLGSYLLILKGKNGEKPSISYMLFSMAGSFLVLAGFVGSASFDLLLPITDILSANSPMAFFLIAIGFMIKTGSFLLHIWLPGAYSEVEDDVSAVFSAVLSKAGIFGFIVLFAAWGGGRIFGIDPLLVLGWVGVLTALFGALFATFQEDVKYLLAYSSMSQIGYILLALSLVNHSGWTTGLYLAIHHLLFKGLVFLAIAGVIQRTGTRYMYQMGGLIKKMPLTFISVLMGIIAMSGVPPLAGFGGKWLLYTSLIESGHLLQAGAAFFASTIAFLYLFRLIHTVFLGQLRYENRDVKEAPIWLIVPQYLFIIAIMAISTFPRIILEPISRAVSSYYTPSLYFEGSVLKSLMGYWDGTMVMMVTMGVFAIPLIWMLIINRKPKKVAQFNIVYAAERPESPQTTHFAHNFFAPYKRALGDLVKPRVTRFWQGVGEWADSLAKAFSNIYTGNGQTYAIHILMYVGILYLIVRSL